MTHTIQSLYNVIVVKLKSLYPANEARAIADRLFENYFSIKPAQRVISGHAAVDADKILLIEQAVNELSNYVPLQYVLGKTWFMDLEFTVIPGVLIPRPETEELVNLIIKSYMDQDIGYSLQMLDIGTGSGCIAISLKHFLPFSEVTAIDVSNEAIVVAETNALKNNTKIKFIHMDILDSSQWSLLPQYDLIVSNPPYVTHAEKEYMFSNVLDYEPHSALFVPDNDPLLFYREIVLLTLTHLRSGGMCVFEINECYGEAVRELFSDKSFKSCLIRQDLHGKDRFVFAIKH